MDSTQFTSDEVDLDAFRARLRKMTDEELIRQGKAGRYMCSPMANFGKPPRKVFLVQLEEVKAEWRRRHPKADNDGSAASKWRESRAGGVAEVEAWLKRTGGAPKDVAMRRNIHDKVAG